MVPRAPGPASENLQGTKPRVMGRARAAGYGDLRASKVLKLSGGGAPQAWATAQRRRSRFGTWPPVLNDEAFGVRRDDCRCIGRVVTWLVEYRREEWIRRSEKSGIMIRRYRS